MTNRASLDSLFSPDSVAVVGASRDPSAVGHRIFAEILRSGFQGPVYPVNPKATHVASVKAYPSMEAIGAPVDLAVLAVPAPVVLETLEDCRSAGVKALVVVSAGFAETGEEGRAREAALLGAVEEGGMRMLGPNCLGLLNTHPDVGLNASFAPVLPSHGPVSLCSQSGALGIAVLSLAAELQLGLGTFASIGNKADVTADDLLEYWGGDEESEVLLFYLESFKSPRRFGRLARSIGGRKPVVVVKAGRSEAGRRAAGSHTAALSGGEEAVEAFFRQTGVIRAATLQEMFGMARALSEQPLPPGRRFAVVTNAGGPGILCADALEAAGLSVAPLQEETQERLREILPEEASTGNPVDMIASAGVEEYRNTVATVLTAEEVDGLVVIHTPIGVVAPEEIEGAIMDGLATARNRREGARKKPVYASIIGGEDQAHLLSEGRSSARPGLAVPTFTFPEEIGRIAGALVRHREWRERGTGEFPHLHDQDIEGIRAICSDALRARGDGWLSVEQARRVLELARIPVAPGGVATTSEQAVRLARDIGYPVAVKLASTRITHKTELAAVKLNIQDDEGVRSALREIRGRLRDEEMEEVMEGVLVQPHLSPAAEVFMGMTEDPVFGPVLAFGLGGIHVEILQDVAFGIAPLSREDARGMIEGIQGFRLLEGYRGHPPGDVEALEEVLLRLSAVADEVEELAELDLNPVMALKPGEGCRVVDARIRVREAPSRSASTLQNSPTTTEAVP